jgi:asparagine synthase (glutamine-hydrolysing)
VCGIAGLFSQGGALPEEMQLQAMAQQLRHRGPDGKGFYLQGPVGLAHTRLSIIDLAGGQQPIHNEDKTLWVVFNGEIFNYLELRAALEQKGHQFYTHSDTEVIVHLYEEYAENFLQHLNGQFAIALWDNRQQTLLLARDRVGIAPLYYQRCDGQLRFASEIKALLAIASEAPTLNPQAFNEFLHFWAPVSPSSFFSGIEELSPGTYLLANAQGLRIHTYWDWEFPESAQGFFQGTEENLCEELRSLLIDATQIRLRADVPVGAYLSGGLDSSILLALIRQHTSTPVRSFSLTFSDTHLDESQHQALVVAHMNTQHSAVQCQADHIAAVFPEVILHGEMPLLRTAPAPMSLLSALAREQGYRVVLTGEGSDEVFGGYDIFKEAKVRDFWGRNPASSARASLLKRLYPYLQISGERASHFLAPFFGQGLDNRSDAFFTHQPRWETTAKSLAFLNPEWAAQLRHDASAQLRERLPASLAAWQLLNKGQYIEAKTLMGGYLLSAQGDRMLMKNSVEGRFPFLDHRVIEFANRLPNTLKIKVLQEKYLLKKAMAAYLPSAIIHRKKQPYRAPDAAAFFQQGRAPADYVESLLSEATLKDYGYFDAKKVALLVKKARQSGLSSTKDNQSLVAVLSTQLWHWHFIKNFSAFGVKTTP